MSVSVHLFSTTGVACLIFLLFWLGLPLSLCVTQGSPITCPDPEHTLLWIEAKCGFAYACECFGVVGEVVLLIFASGDYDIDICEHIVRYLLLQNSLRESSKGGASVYEAFRHAHEVVHAKGFNKASLVFVFFHVNLVITREAIKERHGFAHYRLVDNLVYSWQRGNHP